MAAERAQIAPLLMGTKVELEEKPRKLGDAIRILLELPGPIDPRIYESFLEAVRGAMVHEAKLSSLLEQAGAGMDVDELVHVIEEALSASTITPFPARPEAEFTEGEWAELRNAGIDVKPAEAAHRYPAAKMAVLFANLVATALTTAEAASLLDVEESRIRQRLHGRSLYGIKLGSRGPWRLPRFQFTESGTVPQIESVLPTMPEDLHPIAVWRWFTTPNVDLLLDDEPVSPIVWLSAGQDAGTLARLSADL